MTSSSHSNKFRPVDFFILGAPKSGTSALYEYLSKHPSIFLPKTKIEPHFFSHDIALSARHPDLSSYMKLFSNAPPEALIGEASTWYLYSETAIEEILAHNPLAKCIIMLRNPVDMAHSLHGFNLIKLHEDVTDFEVAWNMQATRRRGFNLPRNVVDPNFVQYFDACALSNAVERVIKRVNPENLLIHIYEDFFDNIQESYDRTLEFLGVESLTLSSFPRVNAYRTWRSRELARMLNNPQGLLQVLYAPTKRALNLLGLHPGRMLHNFNEVKSSRPKIPNALRTRLLQEFKDNNEHMRKLVGHPLDAWRK